MIRFEIKIEYVMLDFNGVLIWFYYDCFVSNWWGEMLGFFNWKGEWFLLIFGILGLLFDNYILCLLIF